VRGNQTYHPISFYKDAEQNLFSDIAKAYQKAVLAFYNHGCRYLQFDDTSWGEFCDLDKRKAYAEQGLDLDQIARNYVKMINEVLTVKPNDMTITMHICRGNFRSTWFSSGGYEPVAKTLFGGCRVDGFFLEYDTDRAGDFKPLRYIQNQKVVLGLITSKHPELEDKEEVKARIREAAKFVPLEQLCLSPQCGFSSTEEGNILTEEDQWKKLTLIKEIAEEVWGA
jgi:5-methyltetrahydropteroyltriglutamate--homocysteine methyltransferase